MLFLYIHNSTVLQSLIKVWNVCRPLSNGQRGEVYEVNGDRVAVILDICEKNSNEEEEKLKEEPSKPSIYWIDGIFSNYL